MQDDLTYRVSIRVAGVVQGVGFRPFVHRHATRFGLAGSVRNTSGCVEIEAEGPVQHIQRLIALLQEGPPNARVDGIVVRDASPTGEGGFVVLESEGSVNGEGVMSPDVATCPRCLREMFDPQNRRFRYPFINCTNCGPRFTITESLPYDRERTSMRGFSLCPDCAGEYRDPLDRRFHAEATACPACGPHVALLDRSATRIREGEDAIVEARARLLAGQILAVKGLGGYHLACDATSDEAARLLRRLKGRPDRPMAVMCRDLSVVRCHCHVSASEARLLTSPERPILLLDRRRDAANDPAPVAESVSPPHAYLGVMLPYTPLHHLLLDPARPASLVMTSGNRSDEPIARDDSEALRTLGSIAEAFLVHDRAIVSRCDDSVGYVSSGRLVLMRRSRGFVPAPIPVHTDLRRTAALGAMLSNAFALAKDRRVYLSQHVGDVDNLQTLTFMREAIASLSGCLRLEPEIVAHDMHPDLPTTRLAREMFPGRRIVAVQHHHAHLVSAMTAASIHGEAQGIVFDGTGWGPDGTIWGGEILVGSARGFRRAAHLRALPLPGGEASIRRPLRLAVAYLHALDPGAEQKPLDLWKRAGDEEKEVVRRLIDRNVNTPMTSSAGRLFDAVSSLLGVRDDVTYEGQAAIDLELLARQGRIARRPAMQFDVTEAANGYIIDPAPLIGALVAALLRGKGHADLAAGFHSALAHAASRVCSMIRDGGGPDRVVLCGGVFQNRLLTRLACSALRKARLVPVPPGSVPVGDGGIALGQVMVANAQMATGTGEEA